jgi:hypothetical protein
MNCADKFLKHSERVGQRFAELNAGTFHHYPSWNILLIGLQRPWVPNHENEIIQFNSRTMSMLSRCYHNLIFLCLISIAVLSQSLPSLTCLLVYYEPDFDLWHLFTTAIYVFTRHLMVSSAFGLSFRLDVALLPVICVNAMITVMRTLFQSLLYTPQDLGTNFLLLPDSASFNS